MAATVLLPNTGLPSLISGPGVADGVVVAGFVTVPLRLFSSSFFLSASTAFTAVACAASTSERLDPSLTKEPVKATSCPGNSRSNSSGVPVTVKGVVSEQSPESPSFKRFGITLTRIAWSLTKAIVSITGRFLSIGRSSVNMVLLFNSRYLKIPLLVGRHCRTRSGGETRSVALCLFAQTRPGAWVYSQRRYLTGSKIHKASVVWDAPMPKQSSQQGQCMSRDGAVNVRLLSIQGFCGAACRQSISFIRLSLNDGGEELVHAGQPFRAILAIFPQGLAEHKLAPIGEISGIQPVMKAPRFETHHTCDRRPRRARVDARDQEVRIRNILSAANEVWHGLPVEPPKQVQPVDQDHCFVQPDFRAAEWLSHTVRFGDAVAIDQEHPQSIRMSGGK